MNGATSLLFDLAIRVAPSGRRDWLAAMRTELEFVPPPQRLGFAGGCLAAAVMWRIWTPQGLRKLVQGGLVAASASLAVFAAILSVLGRFEHLTPVMAALGLAYAGAAVATGRWGLRAAVVFASGGIALNSVFVAAWAGGFAEPSHAGFVRALTVETYLILATFLVAAVAAQALARRLEHRT